MSFVRSPFTLFSIALGFGLSAGIAVGQGSDTRFEGEVTVTATGEEVALSDVPTPTTVITREDMDESLQETVADLLRRVPGLIVARSGDEGKVASVFTRGTESDHTLVLFDGVRLNSPYFGGYDFSQLTTGGLERIEVVRGPYSALYGADAIGGVVNVVPAQAQRGTALQLFAEGGQDDWRRLEGTFGYGDQRFDVFVSGLDREGNGALDNSDFKTRQVLADVGIKWGSGHRIAAVFQDLDNETGIPFSSPGALTPQRRQFSQQRLIAIPLRLRLSDDWSLEANASKVEREFQFNDPDDPFGFTESLTNADTSEARLTSRHSLAAHTLSIGAEWRRDEVTDTSTFGVNLDREEVEVQSAFIQDVWTPSNTVRVVAGVRWDDSETWGSQTSPRLNFGWQISDTLELRGGYGEAFRQPSIGELYFPFSGNTDLKPERSTSYEAGLVGRYRSGASWQLNAFSTSLDQLIDFDYANWTFANIAEAEIQGAEFGLQLPVAQDFRLVSQLTYLDTEGIEGLPLLRRPEFSGSLTLAGTLWRKLRTDLALIWVGERDDVDPVSFERTQADSYLTADLALAWKLWSRTELTLRIVNLMDKAYEEVLGYPAPGRRFLAGIRIGN
ncbi:MAG: TonB-dependent receptor [bacterium]|nr:TonB-dependent receptor [bacterium]